MVGIVNDGGKIVTCRSRDHNLLSASFEVGRSLLLRCVEASALENDVNVELTPRKLSSVRLSVDSNLLTINDDRVISCLNSVLALAVLASETTLCGVILQKVSQHLRRCEVVDCNYLVTLCLKHLTECETADTTETINSYFNICHFTNILELLKI